MSDPFWQVAGPLYFSMLSKQLREPRQECKVGQESTDIIVAIVLGMAVGAVIAAITLCKWIYRHTYDICKKLKKTVKTPPPVNHGTTSLGICGIAIAICEMYKKMSDGSGLINKPKEER